MRSSCIPAKIMPRTYLKARWLWIDAPTSWLCTLRNHHSFEGDIGTGHRELFIRDSWDRPSVACIAARPVRHRSRQLPASFPGAACSRCTRITDPSFDHPIPATVPACQARPSVHRRQRRPPLGAPVLAGARTPVGCFCRMCLFFNEKFGAAGSHSPVEAVIAAKLAKAVRRENIFVAFLEMTKLGSLAHKNCGRRECSRRPTSKTGVQQPVPTVPTVLGFWLRPLGEPKRL